MVRRIAVTLLLLTACNTNPCGEGREELPKKLAGLPILHDGAEVCHADGLAFADINYWGDDLEALKATYTVAFTREGWSRVTCDKRPVWEGVDRLCLDSGRSRVELHFEQTRTGRLAGFFASPSMRVSVFWAGPAEPSDDDQG
jgi:hypothetical protein